VRPPDGGKKPNCAPAFTSSDARLFDYIRKVELLPVLSVTSRFRRLGAKASERVSAGVLGAHLGVIAVRLHLYNRARDGTANSYERPEREVGGGIEFDHPCAAENARGAPSMKRRDHLALFAFARVVHDKEGCHFTHS